MKKSLLIALGILLLTSPVMAGHRSKDGHVEKRMDRLTSELQLTDEQRQPVAAIIREQWKKRREIIRSAFEQTKPQMEALRDETSQRLAEILDEEQLQKYEELGSKRQERMQKHFSHR